MKKYLGKSALLFIIFLIISCSRIPTPFSFVQLCDPQLGMGGYAHDTATLLQAVRQINEMDVDFVVICGDLVNHASEKSYTDFKNILEGFDLPCYMVPGNHDIGLIPNDSTLAFYRRLMGEDYFTMQHKGVSFIFTNTQLWKSDIGEESQKHDAWFKESIENKKRNERTFVIGHYPLFIDSISEEEAYFNLPPDKRNELLELFTESNVVAYLSGHKHELIENNYHGIQLVSGESTSKNFDERAMGFRKWEVKPDTIIDTFIALSLSVIPETTVND